VRGPDEGWVAQQLDERTGYHPAGTPLPGDPFVPDCVDCSDGLNEDECVALAVCNNTAYQELLADLGMARADLIQAGLISNPQLTFYAPNGPAQLESIIFVPLDSLLRPWRVKAARADATRVAERLVQGGLDLVRDVRVAYADLLLAKDRLRLTEESARLRDRIGKLAEARLKAGDASPLEAQTARIDALRGHEEAARFAYDVQVAEARLRTLIGFIQVDKPLPVVEPTALPALEVNLPAVIEEAVSWRPDVRAPLWTAEAARQRVKLACLGQFGLRAGNVLKALGDMPLEESPAVSLFLPIFNQNQGRIAAAKAELERALRAHATARDRAALEVRQAYALYEQAKTDLARWEKEIQPAVAQAERQSLRAFEAGNAPFLLALEASRGLIDARLREAQLRTDLRRAWAELERSAGRRILPPPPPAHQVCLKPEKVPEPRKPGRLPNQAPGAEHGAIDLTANPDHVMTEVPIRVGRRHTP
jgi:cobalt-zinc-cadmium efflux system outer membrane protein